MSSFIFNRGQNNKKLFMAGRIASQVRSELERIVQPGKLVIEICEHTQELIHDLGGKQAFPCHVNSDEVAMNYTSPVGDDTIIEKGSIVSVTIGVHIDGYIANTAKTFCFEPIFSSLNNAAEEALKKAIQTIRDGTKKSEVSTAIERVIVEKGYKPMQNLMGTKMDRYKLNAGILPIVSSTYVRERRMIKGDVYAISIFSVLSNAEGMVVDGPPSNIYLYQKKKRLNNSTAENMLKKIQSEYKSLPFASRWVLSDFPGPEGVKAFSEILRSKCIHSFPQLIERSRAPVAQAGHTVIVNEEGCVVTTA